MALYYGLKYGYFNREAAMKTILARATASISELKKNPSALIEEAEGQAVAILNHNKPTAYLVPAETYEMIMEKLEDYQLSKVIEERKSEKNEAVEVDVDEL
jgi:antitoxin StbD